MAFMREYAAQSSMNRALAAYGGDPFSLRVPKKWKKWQPGKTLKKILPVVGAVSSLVPGIGGVVGRTLGKVTKPMAGVAKALSPLLPLAEGTLGTTAALFGPEIGAQLGMLFAQAEEMGVAPEKIEAARGFARSYGIEAGDPGTTTARTSKRKGAASGTKAKAKAKAAKRTVTAKQLETGKPALAGMPSAKGIASAIGTGAELVAGISSMLGLSGSAAKKGAAAPLFGGGGRRHMNMANVHALRRSLRRIEGFERLVKRVTPHLLTAHRSHRHSTCKRRK